MARARGRGIQFLDVLPEDGERRLMLAILIDAIRAVSVHRPATLHMGVYRVWLREKGWFESNDRSNPFAFVNICDALGINADYVRRCVLKPSSTSARIQVRRYAAKSEEIWHRQRRVTRPLSGPEALAG